VTFATLFTSVFPLLAYLAYNIVVPQVEKLRPSLSVIMNMQRRRWVANATRRESPFDAILSGNIMGSVSFLASTSVLLVLAVFAVFGQLPTLMEALDSLSLDRSYTVLDVQIHLVVMLAMFVQAFFAFTLSLRQFNHFCIMLGALEHDRTTTEEEIEAIARMNALGAKNFNSGIRAYYFSVATVAWFVSEWLAVAACVITVLILAHREFFSSAHRTAASAAVIAARHRKERAP
jgi:Predicted membrane protein